MRGLGLIGLLLALLIVGVLVKKQLSANTVAVLPDQPAATAGEQGATTVRDQSRQIQQQYKQSLDAAMQTPRDVPDDAK